MLDNQHIFELIHTHISASNIRNITPVRGGCSEYSVALETDIGKYFLKCYSSQSSKAEADSLELLRSVNIFKIPKVIGYGIKEGYNYLLLEWIENGTTSKKHWQSLGEDLARLHKICQSNYGLHFDNYIGRLPQINTPYNTWIDFFINCRLLPQLQLGENKFTKTHFLLFDKIFQKLPELIPYEPPSLLHGDLWMGNVLSDQTGLPVLIDPAVYYGNREIEMAFTYLFGGFDEAFYNAYSSIYPVEKDFQKRIELYNLYPLLVHANMFGGNYILRIKQILERLI